MNIQKITNGTGKFLIFIGGAIGVAVICAWALDQNASAWNRAEHRALEIKSDTKFDALHEDILELKQDVKTILEKIH